MTHLSSNTPNLLLLKQLQHSPYKRIPIAPSTNQLPKIDRLRIRFQGIEDVWREAGGEIEGYEWGLGGAETLEGEEFGEIEG